MPEKKIKVSEVFRAKDYAEEESNVYSWIEKSWAKDREPVVKINRRRIPKEIKISKRILKKLECTLTRLKREKTGEI